MWRKGAASNVVLPHPPLALTRRPVKDKGALMQTLRLWLQDLRAISLGQSPGRWPTPSMLIASTWKGTQPLPSLGSARSAAKLSPGEFPRSCFTHPSPTSAVGLRPEQQPQNLDRCPTVGTGLFLVPPFRGASICGAVAPDLHRVCPRQTASELSPYPAPHKAGDLGAGHWQARASESQRLTSSGLSFSLRPQPYGGRSFGKKTGAFCPGSARSARKLTSISLLIARVGDGSGTMCSEAPGLRPTGRLKPAALRKISGQASSSFCADTPALVTGQEPGGTDVPGDALLRCALALRWLLSSARGEGAWPATTSL